MSAIGVEETGDERSIATPDLRLRFRRAGDRWTHAIDVGPGPWRTAADAVEWSADDPAQVPGPTYQELQIRRDGDAVLALAIGQAGRHHFSASFRVSYRTRGRVHPEMDDASPDRPMSRVEIDVADRCRSDVPAPEARYLVHGPPIRHFSGGSDDRDAAGGCMRDWRPHLVWGAVVRNINYDVYLRASSGPSASRVAILDHRHDYGSSRWLVRIAPEVRVSGGTNRFSYEWGHHRVNASGRPEDSGADLPRSSGS